MDYKSVQFAIAIYELLMMEVPFPGAASIFSALQPLPSMVMGQQVWNKPVLTAVRHVPA